MRCLSLIAGIHLLSLTGCATTEQSNKANYQNTVGWLHGSCLAIQNPNLKTGQPITVVTLDKPQEQVMGQIKGKASDANDCYMLAGDRRQVNLESGYTFYKVAVVTEPALAIGLLPSVQGELLGSGGVSELPRFSYCASTEGIHFSIWQDQPHQSERLWRGYYYMGYDMEANCP